MPSLGWPAGLERSVGSRRTHAPEMGRAEDVLSFATPSCCRLFQVCFAPSGRLFAAGGADGKVWVWTPGEGRRVSYALGGGMSVRAVGFAHGGRLLLAAGGDWLRRQGVLAAWDLEDGALRTDLWRHDRPITALAVAPDGDRLVAAAGDGRLRLWDLDAGTAPLGVAGHEDEVLSLDFAADGRLASAGADRLVAVWDSDLRRQAILAGHDRVVRAVAFTGSALASADERRVLLWDLAAGRLLHRQDLPGGGVRGLAVVPGGRTLVSVANPGADQAELRTWAPGEVPRLLRRQATPLTALAFSSDATTLAAADDRGTVRLWPFVPDSRRCSQPQRGQE